MRCFCTAAVLILVLLATPAEAAELEGFGPIKFGMSKDAAFLAIEQQGEWDTNDLLTYTCPFDQGRREFKIHQAFQQGRAADAAVQYESLKETAETCIAMGMRFSGEIEKRYDVDPIARFGAAGEFEAEEKQTYTLDDIFVFIFEKGAFIRMIVEGRVPRDRCRITVLYHAPEAEPLPF